MTEKELDELIEQKKAQTQAVEFNRTEEKFREEFLRIISDITRSSFTKDMRLKTSKM